MFLGDRPCLPLHLGSEARSSSGCRGRRRAPLCCRAGLSAQRGVFHKKGSPNQSRASAGRVWTAVQGRLYRQIHCSWASYQREELQEELAGSRLVGAGVSSDPLAPEPSKLLFRFTRAFSRRTSFTGDQGCDWKCDQGCDRDVTCIWDTIRKRDFIFYLRYGPLGLFAGTQPGRRTWYWFRALMDPR